MWFWRKTTSHSPSPIYTKTKTGGSNRHISQCSIQQSYAATHTERTFCNETIWMNAAVEIPHYRIGRHAHWGCWQRTWTTRTERRIPTPTEHHCQANINQWVIIIITIVTIVIITSHLFSTLQKRKIIPTEFFYKILHPSTCLHYLLPNKRHNSNSNSSGESINMGAQEL